MSGSGLTPMFCHTLAGRGHGTWHHTPPAHLHACHLHCVSDATVPPALNPVALPSCLGQWPREHHLSPLSIPALLPDHMSISPSHQGMPTTPIRRWNHRPGKSLKNTSPREPCFTRRRMDYPSQETQEREPVTLHQGLLELHHQKRHIGPTRSSDYTQQNVSCIPPVRPNHTSRKDIESRPHGTRELHPPVRS